YSHLVHGLEAGDAVTTVRTLIDLGLPIFDPMLETDLVFDGLEEFRQHLGGRLTLTMLRCVGQSLSVHEVDRSAMIRSIAILKSLDQRSRAGELLSHDCMAGF
ncbi:MAG: hypothetical protein ACK52S_14880, partial [Pirellula sp.]